MIGSSMAIKTSTLAVVHRINIPSPVPDSPPVVAHINLRTSNASIISAANSTWSIVVQLDGPDVIRFHAFIDDDDAASSLDVVDKDSARTCTKTNPSPKHKWTKVSTVEGPNHCLLMEFPRMVAMVFFRPILTCPGWKRAIPLCLMNG